MGDDTPKATPKVTPATVAEKAEAPENKDQTWIAHVENGETKARVKTEDWPKYAKENNL